MKRRPTLSIRALLRQFEADLDPSNFPEEVKNRAPGRLKQYIQEFRERPENRGRKRVKRDPMRRIRKTATHLIHALRHARDPKPKDGGHEDANVRARARELVRSLQHLSWFEEIEGKASNFNGLLRKVGHRRKENERKRTRSQFEIGQFRVVELNSVDQLRAAGRTLGLCVARRDDVGRKYHSRLRKKASAFYRVERRTNRKREAKKLIGLIEIDRETRHVRETAGRRNKTLKLKRKVACEVLRVLEATPNDIDTFTRVGAFSFILDESPRDLTPIQVYGHEYRFWFDSGGKQIAVQKRRALDAIGKRRGSTKWSLFVRDDQEPRVHRRRGRHRRPVTRSGEWHEVSWHPGAMTTGELVDLLIRSPEIAERIRGAFQGHTGSVETSEVELGTWDPADFLDAALGAPTELGEVSESIPALGDDTEF